MENQEILQSKHLFSTEQKMEKWGYGEWVEELDYLRGKYKNSDYAIIRHPYLGILNGYIHIDKEHSWYEKCFTYIKHLEVHGGLTYAKKSEDGEFWIGFDTGHLGDLIPLIEQNNKKIHRENKLLEEIKKEYPNSPLNDVTYRNIEYVRKKCEKLIDQMVTSK